MKYKIVEKTFSILAGFTGCIISVFIITGCQFDFTPRALQIYKQHPIVVFLAYDVSISAQEVVPEITPLAIDTLLSLVRYRSGEFGFTAIGEKKPRLTSLRFMPETGDIRNRKRKKQLNNRQLSRVRREVYEIIRDRSDKRTHLFDALELSLTFLSEPHLPDSANRFLIVVSDFEDDVRNQQQRQPLQVPENITVLALGSEPLAIEKILTPGPNVIPYTSLDGVIHFLNQEKNND